MYSDTKTIFQNIKDFIKFHPECVVAYQYKSNTWHSFKRGSILMVDKSYYIVFEYDAQGNFKGLLKKP